MKPVADPAPDAALARQRLIEALVATGAEDRAAFQAVYRMTSAKLFGICLRICGDRQAAEDVLHEVYILIWKRAGAFEPGRASPISWLATIARNRAIDWRRAHRMPASDAALPDVASDDASQIDVLLEDEAARILRRCLEELEARARDAIRTAFFNGVTYAELAAREGVPVGTMKSRVRRGLLQLKGCIGER